MPCANCGTALPVDARFCMTCGSPLRADLERDERAHARVAGAAPARLVTKMRGAPVSGERKRVTALFGDVVGSTTLAEAMGPEDWVGVMNRAFDVMSQAIYRYEGTVASLIGDGILAFFGAPIAHEDDPERAVLAGLAMVEGVEGLARELEAERGIDFRIRVGINSGEVVVGNVGSNLRYEYTALGDTMNVAARMESAAPPGGVLVTAETCRFVRDRFDVEDRGKIQVKGRAQPVHAYRVIGRAASPAPSRGIAGLTSALVGRDEELGRLCDLVGGLGEHGAVALVSGEPGIGKSRLLAELRERTADAAVSWAEGQCLSYGRNVPYHLVIDLLRSLVGAAPGAENQETVTALHELVAARLGKDDPAADYLAHLMSLPLDPEVARRLDNVDPAGLLADYVRAFGRLLVATTADRPLVAVCEDVHWIDPSSVELLNRVMRQVEEQAVLWVWTRRPQAPPETEALIDAAGSVYADHFRELTLAPMTGAESRRLVANLLEIESLAPQVRDLIVERSDGNPFFVEEVIRMLIERGTLEHRGGSWIAVDEIDNAMIPETLHGLLLARIDALPSDARHALLVASVIGRTFAARVLDRVLAT
jgi:class 3 adenylate cyclase